MIELTHLLNSFHRIAVFSCGFIFVYFHLDKCLPVKNKHNSLQIATLFAFVNLNPS